MPAIAPAETAAFLSRLERAWRRSDEVFRLLAPEAIWQQPIPLRQPFMFYLGHLPAFAWNQIWRGLLGRRSHTPALDELFARGIDPVDVDEYRAADPADWPSVAEVLRYRDRVRDQLSAVLLEGEWLDPQVLRTVIEHELMHHETLLYMLQQLPLVLILPPREAGFEEARVERFSPDTIPPERVAVPGGRVRLGASRRIGFGWDNEFPQHDVEVDGFAIDALPVRNRDFREFVEAGGYEISTLWDDESWAWRERRGLLHPLSWSPRDEQWVCRALWEEVPWERAADWPVSVSWAEAQAFARWRGQRLPTEAEFHQAAYGTPGGSARTHPWGDGEPRPEHGNLGFRHWAPRPAGSHPAGASAWGVHELVGNGWEWTSTRFAPFPGFVPMPHYPGYSADFFDGRHFVLLGASWATDETLVRPSFRNWFQPHYPYVFSKFRCVSQT